MHPIVAQMKPNEGQKPAVLARDRDVVVTAGAGTGKTRTLVARYLSLLAEGKPLRAIVAITFTLKAAQEMRNRIRAEMRRYLDQPGLLPAERLHWDTLYNELDAGRIGTIHSLCSEILRAHPAEAGLDPRFDVLDEGQAGILVNEAIDEAMAWAADDETAVILYSLLGERSLRGTLEGLMGQRLEAQDAFGNLPGDPWSRWSARLLPPIRAFVNDGRTQSAFADLLALRADGTLDRAEASGDRLAEPLRHLLNQWDDIIVAQEADDWASVSAGLSSLRGYMKLSGSKQAWSPADPKAIIKELRQLYDEQLGELVGDGINLALDQLLAQITPALSQIFSQADGAYRRLKKERQALDFDDLEDMSVQLLRGYFDVRERWRDEVSAILVDEYQDTNGRQRDLVNLLNANQGKLFIVGDAKQSIYRFRGAEVAVFRQERRRIEGEGGQGYALATSYRAHRDLLKGLNDLLQPVLGDQEDPDRPWREPFAPLNHYRERPAASVSEPFIELQLTVGSKGDGALHRAAAALAGTLIEQQDAGLSYGDVAVLCRASTSFGPYEDAFDEASIPYLTVAGRGFFDRPEIRDLLNALQAVADPADNVALVGLLRSPVMGFSDMALYQLNREWRESGRIGSLWRFLEGRPEATIRQAAELIDRLHKRSGRMPVAALLKELLDITDYRAALLQAGYPRAARNVAKLLSNAHSSGIVSVAEFLEYVEGIRAGAARDGEARATAGNVVRIMSVHAAKGLEFPVVVIGDINYSRRFRSGLLLDPELGVLPRLADEEGRLPGIYRLLAGQAADQEEAETERLLYVAATRAEEKLILNGCIRLTGGGKPGWLAGWLKKVSVSLNLTGQHVDYDPDGDRAIRLDLAMADTAVACTIFEPGYAPAQAVPVSPPAVQDAESWSPVLLEPVLAGRQQVDEAMELFESDPPQRVWRVIPRAGQVTAPAWIVGKLVHDALAIWYFPQPGFENWVRSRAREYGLVDRVRLDDAVKTTGRLLKRLQSHELYDELIAAEQRLHEVPYSLAGPEGVPEHGFIDVLYLHQGRWTLIDFKTDRIKDAKSFARSPTGLKYQDQLRRYRLAVERLTGQRPQTVLCLLNCAGRICLEPDITQLEENDVQD